MKRSHIREAAIQYGGLLAVLLAMITVFSLQSKNFFQKQTLVSIANPIPDLTCIAVGKTLVLIVGGIDLSVGSVLALSSTVLGTLMVDHGWSLWPATAICLLTGTACGLVNGLISIGFRIPSFIVTLGMLDALRNRWRNRSV